MAEVEADFARGLGLYGAEESGDEEGSFNDERDVALRGIVAATGLGFTLSVADFGGAELSIADFEDSDSD